MTTSVGLIKISHLDKMAVPNCTLSAINSYVRGCYHAQRLCYLQELFYKSETLEDSFVLVIISASGRLHLSFQFSSHRAAVPAGRDDRGCRETRTLRS